MEKNVIKSNLGLAMILGSVWGLCEVALGAGLHACAVLISGSVMTAVALFFLAAGWAAGRRWYVPVLIILIASFFKLFDALLLSLPVIHGAIANPVFAFITEGVAFLILISIFRYDTLQKRSARALLGGGAALIAVCMFPLVKFATTIPACVYPGTAVPQSIMFAPVAIILSALTVPLGFYAGEKIRSQEGFPVVLFRNKIPGSLVSPAILIVCLALVVLFRLIIPHGLA
jgi:hypothetical protein